MTHRFALRAFATALIIVAIVGCGGPLQSTPSQTSQLPTVDDFTPEKLGEYRGKVVVLNFWAAWCLPCRAEMPTLEAIYQEYRDQGVVVLGVNVSEHREEIIAFAQKYGLTFPMLRDPRQQAIRAHNVRVLPTTFFLDRQGDVHCWEEEQTCRKLGAMTEGFVKQRVETLVD